MIVKETKGTALRIPTNALSQAPLTVSGLNATQTAIARLKETTEKAESKKAASVRKKRKNTPRIGRGTAECSRLEKAFKEFGETHMGTGISKTKYIGLIEDLCGITRGNLQNHLKYKYKAHPERLMALKAGTGLNPDWVRTGDGKMFVTDEEKTESPETVEDLSLFDLLGGFFDLLAQASREAQGTDKWRDEIVSETETLISKVENNIQTLQKGERKVLVQRAWDRIVELVSKLNSNCPYHMTWIRNQLTDDEALAVMKGANLQSQAHLLLEMCGKKTMKGFEQLSLDVE